MSLEFSGFGLFRIVGNELQLLQAKPNKELLARLDDKELVQCTIIAIEPRTKP